MSSRHRVVDRRSTPLVAALLLVAATCLGAQGTAPARAGEQIRLEVVGPATASVGVHCSGEVRRIALDTLVVASAGACPRGSYLADLHVMRGGRGSRLTHAALGVLAGGIAGAIVSRASAGDCVAGCVGDDQEFVSGVRTMVFTATGALVGAVVGVVLPAGPRWVRAGVARPLRVLGLEAHPSLRVSVAARAGR